MTHATNALPSVLVLSLMHLFAHSVSLHELMQVIRSLQPLSAAGSFRQAASSAPQVVLMHSSQVLPGGGVEGQLSTSTCVQRPPEHVARIDVGNPGEHGYMHERPAEQELPSTGREGGQAGVGDVVVVVGVGEVVVLVGAVVVLVLVGVASTPPSVSSSRSAVLPPHAANGIARRAVVDTSRTARPSMATP